MPVYNSLADSSTYADGVWEHIARACASDGYTYPELELLKLVERDGDASHCCSSVEHDLLPFIARFLCTGVVEEVRSVLRDLGVDALPRDSLLDAATHIIKTYCIDELYKEPTDSNDPTDSSEGDRTTVSGGLGPWAGGSGDGAHDTGGIGGKQGGNGGIGGTTRGNGEDGEDRDGGGGWSPEPNSGAAERIIKKAALKFSSHWTSSLAPFDPLKPSARAPLFHATRLQHLRSFQFNGIRISNRRNELTIDGAFYASTSLPEAVAHCLKYKHQAIFIFEVDPSIILASPTFRTRILGVPENPQMMGYHERYRQFCTFVGGNWANSQSAQDDAFRHRSDFIVAPICINPYSTDVGMQPNLTGTGPRPLQIAARTPKACLYLEQCVTKVLLEERSSRED
ncbi:hypothetical protein DFH09DRAFT_1276588 [Mycena vulgaris]|nr:hypothetical protein DFH09DRAFT_1276588 [Mycena vulgaris]